MKTLLNDLCFLSTILKRFGPSQPDAKNQLSSLFNFVLIPTAIKQYSIDPIVRPHLYLLRFETRSKFVRPSIKIISRVWAFLAGTRLLSPINLNQPFEYKIDDAKWRENNQKWDWIMTARDEFEWKIRRGAWVNEKPLRW